MRCGSWKESKRRRSSYGRPMTER
ncbi:hypothetical protein HMPREF1207_00001, partial [Paenibacillus sp. HGH0039]